MIDRESTRHFSSTYWESRDLFRARAKECGAKVDTISLRVGPEYTIDIAVYGDESCDTALLHVAGVHGVEGYVGSAIQSALLADPRIRSSRIAHIFVHALNPYGMAYCRRFNENNVDLNRNFLCETDDFVGVPERYEVVRELLAPDAVTLSAPLFYLRAVKSVMKHGFKELRQAVAGGQYEYEHDLYFGGKCLQESAGHLLNFVAETSGAFRRLGVIDVHSGLGVFGEDMLIVNRDQVNHWKGKISGRFEKPVIIPQPCGEEVYTSGGELSEGIHRVSQAAEVLCILQEFGTYNGLKIVRALAVENALYHRDGDSSDLRRAQRHLLNCFVPESRKWRSAVLYRGQRFYWNFVDILLEEVGN